MVNPIICLFSLFEALINEAFEVQFCSGFHFLHLILDTDSM